MRRSSHAPEMDFGYATSVDDIFDTPAKREDWTEDDVEEGRPLLRVGSWSNTLRGVLDDPLLGRRHLSH